MLYLFYLLKYMISERTRRSPIVCCSNHSQTAGTGNNKLNAINSSEKEMYKTKK